MLNFHHVAGFPRSHHICVWVRFLENGMIQARNMYGLGSPRSLLEKSVSFSTNSIQRLHDIDYINSLIFIFWSKHIFIIIIHFKMAASLQIFRRFALTIPRTNLPGLRVRQFVDSPKPFSHHLSVVIPRRNYSIISVIQPFRPPTTNRLSLKLLVRTISNQKQQEIYAKNRYLYKKWLVKWALLVLFLIIITPYVAPLKGAARRWEPRREKKRRLRRERQAAAEGSSSENSGHDSDESSTGKGSLLPSVKAAEVVEEGTGYVPPKSHRFNFVADAVDVAAPAVVYIEIQGRYVCIIMIISKTTY